MISALVGYSLSPDVSGLSEDAAWRWMFASECIPVAPVGDRGSFSIPESPRWLMEKGRVDEARQVLTRIDGPSAADQAIKEIDSAMAEETGGWLELYLPGIRIALYIAVMLGPLQQFTGVSPMLLYVPMVFQKQDSKRLRTRCFKVSSCSLGI